MEGIVHEFDARSLVCGFEIGRLPIDLPRKKRHWSGHQGTHTLDFNMISFSSTSIPYNQSLSASHLHGKG